ncbi:MAG: RNase H-like domain-containing protein, partial [Bacteroidota bacterium]
MAGLIRAARAEETARANADEIEKSSAPQQESSSDLYKVSKAGKYSSKSFNAPDRATSGPANSMARRNRPDPTPDTTPNPPAANRTCFKCGGKFPHKNSCPAVGKTCIKCGKLNHFASQCRGGDRNVRAAQVRSSSEEDLMADLGEVRCIGSVVEKACLVRIGSKEGAIEFNPDTGADVTIVDHSVYAQLHPLPQLSETKIRLMPYGASKPLRILGCYKTELSVGCKTTKETIYVSHDHNRGVSLLSRPASVALGLITFNFPAQDALQFAVHTQSSAAVDEKICPTPSANGQSEPPGVIGKQPGAAPWSAPNRKTLRPQPEGSPDHPLLQGFDDICHGVGCHKDLAISLPLKEGAKHNVAASSRIPVNLYPSVKAEVERLESEGVFESVPVDDNTQSISRMVPVPKRIEGSDELGVRITFDWRELNKNLDKVNHMVLTVEELKAILAKAKVFSQIDLKDAFYQLPLDEESKRLTTFSTPWGLKRCTRLVQGATPSSAICHEVLRRDLEGIQGAINIADNILVFGCGDTSEGATRDHDRALLEVLEMFRRTGLTLNRKKCNFSATKTKFFGYIFSDEGISPDPDKVAALRAAEAPKSKEEVRSFLGMAGFNSQFIPNYATISGPLRYLTKKGVNFSWGTAEQAAFKAITNAISETTMLSYFDTQKETALFTDASPIGINATLAQMDESGHYKPVNIASRALNETEQEYHQLEREALGMQFGCYRFKMFLQGIPFTHFIDPEPLKGMMEKTKKEAPARIENIRLKLQGFNSTIKLVKGKHNPADYLSRHPLPYKSCSKAERINFREIQNHIFVIAHMLPEAITVTKVKEASKQDPVISKIMKLLRAGTTKCPEDDKRLAPFKPVWAELSIAADMLLRGERIVLPQGLIKEALKIAHEGHMGVAKTKRYLRTSVWFPKMDALTERLVRNCIPCQAVTPSPHREPLRMTPLPPEPWQLVAADIFGPLPGGEKILVLKCLRSKWPEVKIFLRHQSTNAEGVISAMDKMFAVHGIPDTVRTDNGPPFNSKDFKDFARRNGFQTQKVTPLWPEANGQAEAFMKCLGKVVRTAHIEGRDWKKALDNFLLAYRATPHPSTGVAPAHLMYPGRRFQTRLPCHSAPSVSKAAVEDFNKRAMETAKRYADQKRHTRQSDIAVGDTVLVQQRKQNKLTSFYDPLPYKVISLKGSMVTAARKGHQIVRNSSFFKKVMPQNVCPADAPASRKGKAETPSLPVLLPVLPDRRVPVPNHPPAAAPAGRQRENHHPGPDGQAEGRDYDQVDDANSGDEEFVDAEGVDNPIEGAEAEPPQA